MRIAWGAERAPSQVSQAYAAVGAVVLAAARFVPFESFPIVLCPLRRIAHVPCPACGFTRAFCRTVHGELGSAFSLTPLGTFLALALVVFVTWVGLRLTFVRRGLRVEVSARDRRILTMCAVILPAVNWLYLLSHGVDH